MSVSISRRSWLRGRRSALATISVAAFFGGAARAQDAGIPWPTTWTSVTQGGVAVGDPEGDENNAFDIVGDAATPMVQVTRDASYFYVQIRIDSNPLTQQGTELAAFGWGCEIDVDGDLGSYEYLALADGVGAGGGDLIQWRYNATPDATGPGDKAETVVVSYPGTTNWRVQTVTPGAFGGDDDYLLQMAFSLADLGVVAADGGSVLSDLSKPLTFICGSSASGDTLTKDLGIIGSYTQAPPLSTLASDPLLCTSSGCTPPAGCNVEGGIQCTNASLPRCEPTSGVCVECLGSADCNGGTCDLATHACLCTSADAAACDADGDGLSDGQELTLGTSPTDADSDDDGVSDGMEPSPGVDTDGDGLINALDPDSDNDGLFDGTEMGRNCLGAGITAGAATCVADGDNGLTVTDPLVADTDGGGVNDGAEDWNLNGAIDAGETDPTAGNGADDLADGGGDGGVRDTDGDGLSDGQEATLGTSPTDADSDDDGVPDGLEANPGVDTNGDGTINALDPDSDGDGLFDGTEMGRGCTGAGTAPGSATCIADGDLGATRTSPLLADTDGGGVVDGTEDANHNGVVDAGETNPTLGNGADDSQVDGGPDSGIDAGAGGTGSGGAGTGGAAATGGVASDASAGGASGTGRSLEGAGCNCSTAASSSGSSGLLALGGLAMAFGLARRRRR